MATRDKITLRFAVGAPSELYSSVWRLWTNADDVYLATRNEAMLAKISFHASGRCRFAGNRPSPTNPTEDRALYKWAKPPEYTPGWTRLFCIAVLPRQTRRPFKNQMVKTEGVKFIPPPSENEKVVVNIALSPATATEADIHNNSDVEVTLVGRIPTNTRAVWAFAHKDGFSESERAWAGDTFAKLALHMNDDSGDQPDSAFMHIIQDTSLGPMFPPCLIDMPLGEENLRLPG